MRKVSRTIQRPKSRLSKVRGVLLLMVAFVVYFVMAKPAATAVVQSGPSAVSRETLVQQVLHEEDEKRVGERVRQSDPEREASSQFELDEFVATLPHLNLLLYVAQYDFEDMCLPPSPYDRGVDYPPDALI